LSPLEAHLLLKGHTYNQVFYLMGNWRPAD